MSDMTLASFEEIPDQMLWEGAALAQIEQFRLFAEELGFPWAAVGHHTSKSIPLPVIRILCGDITVYLRDNFHDLNICVVATKPINLPLSVLFDGVLEPLSWDWYLEEVRKAREYSWRGWTNEQMDAPGLLALSDTAPTYMVKTLKEKARWVKRLTDPEWYSSDWSSGTITWEGEFGPGTTMWVLRHPYMEGIGRLVPQSAAKPYAPGCKGFALALYDLGHVANLIQRLGN